MHDLDFKSKSQRKNSVKSTTEKENFLFPSVFLERDVGNELLGDLAQLSSEGVSTTNKVYQEHKDPHQIIKWLYKINKTTS